MSDEASRRRQRLIGIALMCGAVAAFAVLDATAKYLMIRLDPIQVVWARYAFAFLVPLLFLNPITRPGLMRTGRPVLQVVRSGLLLLATLFNFAAIKFLQLDQALAILFSATFFIAALSGPMLGEWIGWRRWTAIGVGFVGVLVVTRPGVGEFHPAVLLALAAAVTLAFYNIYTRELSRTDSNETTLFYSNFVGAVVMSAVLPFFWAPIPTRDILLMLVVGGFAAFGHFLLIAGHRLAPAAILAPFSYTQLVWATTLGFLYFGDLPDRWTLAGASIVVGSGLYMIYRERKLKGET